VNQPPLSWRKSPHSNPSGNCVEIAALPNRGVAVRDSKNPDGEILAFTAAEWAAFAAGVRDGSLAV
jgi:hypothetical protein